MNAKEVLSALIAAAVVITLISGAVVLIINGHPWFGLSMMLLSLKVEVKL